MRSPTGGLILYFRGVTARFFEYQIEGHDEEWQNLFLHKSEKKWQKALEYDKFCLPL
jgi:hypothetical protein